MLFFRRFGIIDVTKNLKVIQLCLTFLGGLEMTDLKTQREQNVIWIKYEYGMILNSLEWFHGALLRIGHYTETLGYREENISDNELEKIFNTDLLMYCYWIASLDGNFNNEKNQLIMEMFPFAYDFKRARKEIKKNKKGFAQMKDTFFPASLGGISTVNDLRVELLKQDGEEVDIKEEFAYSRAFFRLYNMIADTLVCYDGKKHEEIMTIVKNRLAGMSDLVYEIHGYHPNETNYEHYFPTQDGEPGFKPLYEIEESSNIVPFPRVNDDVDSKMKEDNEVGKKGFFERRKEVKEERKKEELVTAIIINFELSKGRNGLAELIEVAEKGSVEAQERLGDAFSTDEYNIKDIEKAEDWYFEAIKNGSSHAKYGLVKLYLDEGIMLEQDDFDLLIEAAAEDDDDAQFLLGTLFFEGDIVEQDIDEAEYWMKRAVDIAGTAEQQYGLVQLYLSDKYTKECPPEMVYMLKDIIEDPDYSELAQCTLANCYRFGLGTKINNSEAQYLLKDGINKGFPLAKYYYAQLFIEGDGVEKDTKYAYQLLLESAEEGCQESQLAICYDYISGEYNEIDYCKAAEWYSRAFDINIDNALYELGQRAYFGLGIDENISAAVELFTLASSKGNYEAMELLGLCFADKEWEGHDYNKAKGWYEKAITNGSIDACGLLAEIYEEGFAGEIDYEKAFSYYLLGDERGDKDSELKIGILLAQGKGIDKDLARAKEIYEELYKDEEFVNGNEEELENLKNILLNSIG